MAKQAIDSAPPIQPLLSPDPAESNNSGMMTETIPTTTPTPTIPATATLAPSVMASVIAPAQVLAPVSSQAQPNETTIINNVPTNDQMQELQSQQPSQQKTVITKVKLTDELNIFDWFRTTDIINQIAEKAKNSVDTVITVLDPGMKEYLYSGGNINIIVISDSNCLVGPIRDAFQCVFGRATVVAAKYNPPESVADYPVKLARGLSEAVVVAQERIKKLRLDTSNVPQNQVVVAVQPSLVNINVQQSTDASSNVTNGSKTEGEFLPKWFLTYSMVIEDPVLGATMSSYSQFVPMETEVVSIAEEAKFPDDFKDGHLGFSKSISELMTSKLKLTYTETQQDGEGEWLRIFCGLDETRIIHDLGISLAHLYSRKRLRGIDD